MAAGPVGIVFVIAIRARNESLAAKPPLGVTARVPPVAMAFWMGSKLKTYGSTVKSLVGLLAVTGGKWRSPGVGAAYPAANIPLEVSATPSARLNTTAPDP
jgi:hypothetical protein